MLQMEQSDVAFGFDNWEPAASMYGPRKSPQVLPEGGWTMMYSMSEQ